MLAGFSELLDLVSGVLVGYDVRLAHHLFVDQLVLGHFLKETGKEA